MARPQVSRRLSARDAQWFLNEDPTAPMHGGVALHYAGDITRDELIDLFEAKLALAPRLKQRLVPAPFGIAMRSWQDDPEFDLRNHISELTLPAPGDDHQLGEALGTLHSELLDRNRPLWAVTLIHGRPDGNTVMYLKVHHSCVDGPAMMDLIGLLHDPQSGVEAPPLAPMQEPPKDGPVGEFQAAVMDRTSELVDLTRGMMAMLRPEALMQQTQQMMSLVPTGLDMLKPLRRMPWNGPLSSQRRVAWESISFSELRQVRKELDATINDLVLAIMAGGLAKYLQQHGISTKGLELRDMVTVSVRKPEERGTLGNRVTAVSTPLYVGIDDPLERLAAQKAAMSRIKETNQAEFFSSMYDFAGLIPPIVFELGSIPRPAMPRLPVNIPMPAMFSVISSNIVGPQRRLHLGGHELVDWHGVGICMLNIGLFIVFQSYADKASFTITVDPTLVPDEWQLIDHFREALHELHAAARTGRQAVG